MIQPAGTDIEWYTDSDKKSFDIWVSDDNKDYEKAASVKDTTSYQYPVAEKFEKKYFKVSLSGKSGSIESFPFIVTKTEDGYESDFLDSDGDGLYDFVETTCGTDINKKDTDGDGLSNIREIKLGTDPKTADTDKDGLKDGDELNIYGTDPLLYDTDKDGLKDGDEPHINLDPSNRNKV